MTEPEMLTGWTAADIRGEIWQRLKPVAKPDSRFHLDFGEVIPDFEGSDMATSHLLAQGFTEGAKYVFITPDNGLVELRRRLLEAGATLVVSTYGIRRGFVLLQPDRIPAGCALYAAWLDGLEHFGRSISLAEIKARGRFDFMVTGASAVSLNGVRFGKGHGYFDMEWGMFTDIGVVDEATHVTALVHDVQVVQDKLLPGPTDILVDSIAMPSRFLHVSRAARPFGIKWELLGEETIALTPPLGELREMQKEGRGLF
jgi:5-formyltetrahydrofolate cyclo-ligase